MSQTGETAMTKEQEILWLAGLLEGEGSFTSNGWPHHKGMCVKLQMTDEDVVAHAAQVMRTPLGKHAAPYCKGKLLWTTCASGDKAIAIARTVLPFMGQRRKARIEELLARAATRMMDPRDRGRRSGEARRAKRRALTFELPLVES